MPNDVKMMVSGVTLVVAGVLAWWSGSPVRPEYGTFIIVTAILMVVAMWVFPEAGGGKKRPGN